MEYESPLMTDRSTELEESVMKIRYGDTWQVWPFVIVKPTKLIFILDLELEDFKSDSPVRRTHIVGGSHDLLHMCMSIMSKVHSATVLEAPHESSETWTSKRLVSIEGIREYYDDGASYPAYFLTENGERITDQILHVDILESGEVETLWQQSTNNIQSLTT